MQIVECVMCDPWEQGLHLWDPESDVALVCPGVSKTCISRSPDCHVSLSARAMCDTWELGLHLWEPESDVASGVPRSVEDMHL